MLEVGWVEPAASEGGEGRVRPSTEGAELPEEGVQVQRFSSDQLDSTRRDGEFALMMVDRFCTTKYVFFFF